MINPDKEIVKSLLIFFSLQLKLRVKSNFLCSLLTPGFSIQLLGYVFTRGGYVELSKKLSLPLGCTLDRYQ